MAKLVLTDLGSLTGLPAGTVTIVNNNNASLETALENTLSRDGTAPNQMNADFDMNDYDILNAGDVNAATSTIGVLTNTTANITNLVLDGTPVEAGDLVASGVQSVNAGTNVTVDNTDPQNPVISATGGGSISDGDKGDIVVSSSGAVWSIDTGVIVNADINASAAIDATKIADGSVTNTELQYINSLSSNAQTQLDAKQPLDADLTSWAAITRASGFDTFVATPSSANLASLVTDEVGSGRLLFSPSTTVDNTLPRFDGTIGAIQSSGVVVDDTDYVTGIDRITLDQAPTYDLAANVLAAHLLIPLSASTLTVAASKRFNGIGFRQADGGNLNITAGAASESTGIYSTLAAASGSDATGNVYGMVAHATNAGPATTRGIHAGGYGSGTSSGVLNAVGGEITPVSTQGYTSAFFASLNSSGVHDKAIGYAAESGNGDRYLVAFGNALAALPINVAYFRAWMATGSSTNARAFSVLNNAGSEIAYWHKDGSIVAAVSVTAPSIIGSTDLVASSASNGITITQSAVSRNHVNGSMTFAAGTAAGNTFAIQTGGSTRFDVSDTSSRANGYFHALLGTAIPAGGTAGAGYRLSTTTNFGIFFGSGAPSLSAAQGSIYLRSDGSSTSTRLYVNTNGSTTWTNVTTAA